MIQSLFKQIHPIFQRIQEGQEIKQTDPEIQNLYKTFDETLKTVQKINTTILSKDEIRKIKILCQEVDSKNESQGHSRTKYNTNQLLQDHCLRA